MSEAWDDHELLERLRAAMLAAEAVPREIVEAGKSAYAWRDLDLDVELAELTYDSAMHLEELAALRADSAVLRALTFAATQLTIELEITDSSLLGQVVPPQAGEVRVQDGSGDGGPQEIDDLGVFVIRGKPHGPFRLHCHTQTGLDVSTSWFTL
ncbi:hypothetical protein [Nonomuraea gerenzanensis]|uniref:Uncharacterized protein n=1 Tax=Nonomuraea gerenzanensis TaxID=93944 RepID=A0A1M4EGL4_9ACTN|nr:hypothetical protein [Nonomuraea gerenzanensis]UBU09386.1 hypothetical protein LCN96_34100 [Nonomuraea gerenzanensis]SBO97798.1 hypothetical protein BN4615_P7314 [Nonomuraea gerenzanensis]